MSWKKLIAILTVMAMPVTSYAAVKKAELDINTNSIVVEGKLVSGMSGKEVKIIVLKPHDDEKIKYTLSDLNDPTKFNEALFVSDTVTTTAGGEYDYTVGIPDGSKAGEYQVYIQDDDDSAPVWKGIYYADDTFKKNKIKDINDSVLKDDAVLTTQQAFEAAIRPLALDSSLIATVGAENIANILGKYIKADRKLDEATPTNAVTLINKLILAEAYNRSKTAVVYGLSGDELQTNVGIYDFSAETDFYSAYNNLLSAEGKNQIRAAMLNSGFVTPEDVMDRFCELVVIKGINNPKEDGTGHIQSLINKANATRLSKSFDDYINNEDAKKLIKSFGDYADMPTGIAKSNVEVGLKSTTCSTINEFVANLSTLLEQNPAESQGSSPRPGPSGVSSQGGYVNVGDITNTAGDTVFTDIDSIVWAKEAINYLYKNGIVSGVGDNKFAPNNLVTREQFVVMLVNALNIGLPEESNEFSDVASGAYYARHIAAATQLGIINGMGDGSFGVGKAITRQDICTIVKRACFVNRTATNGLNFIDSNNIAEYAKDAVAYLAEAGIVNGFEDGSFAPLKSCTRAQAAKILYETLMTY